MSRYSARREYAKKTRDRVLWHTPGLQRVIRAGARKGAIPPSVWRRLHPRGAWTLHAPDGTPFRYDSAFPHDGMARHVVWTDMRHWETTTQPLLFDLAKEAKVFVDVGAYSGIYTILACVANPRLRAIAFEPNPVKLEQLRSNVALNGLRDRVTLVGKALSSEPGRAGLAIPADDSQASLAHAAPGARTVDVPVTTGDEALGDLPVGLVKIDVEGLEPQVLTGMAGVLAAHRPKIIAECLDQRALDRLRRVTAALGHRYAYHIDQAGLVPVDDRFAHPYRFPNYLFTAEPMNV
ncbi:FkbM family methyltransferase [Actinomadura scrupuli]|uniref:FkbM family methyltransferase n=1 Tax=Actinomadura scrupuli TaxID=559629 RepID=UPI003D98E1D4